MIDPVFVGALVLLFLLLGFMPAVRGTAAAFDALENPGRQETEAERKQNGSNLARLLICLLALFALAFVWKLGG